MSKTSNVLAKRMLSSFQLPSNRPHRELRMDVLKQANDYGVQLYEEHQRFVKSFDARWRSDENVMLLLSAIALFTPERSNVLHKDVVKLEQVTDATKFIGKGSNTKISSITSVIQDANIIFPFTFTGYLLLLAQTIPGNCMYKWMRIKKCISQPHWKTSRPPQIERIPHSTLLGS